MSRATTMALPMVAAEPQAATGQALVVEAQPVRRSASPAAGAAASRGAVAEELRDAPLEAVPQVVPLAAVPQGAEASEEAQRVSLRQPALERASEPQPLRAS
ncbi:MAG: hypothetical protein WAK85_04870 [Xanthobacteraceae bacterium]